MKKWLRRLLIGVGALLGLVVLVLVGVVVYAQVAWDRPYKRPVPQLTAPTDSATLARGEYLYKYGNQCWGCHSQGTADPNAIPAGGREFDLSGIGPGFGFWYSSNLTPDPETGIGAWSDGEVVRALREGLSREGRLLFPIMPGDFYKGLSDQDALAIVAYLRSLPPVKNQVPANRPSLVAKALASLKVMKPQPSITQPVLAPPPGATAEYGKYLATNASGCAECHTPRDTNTGKVFLDRPFAGSAFAFGGDLEDLPAAAYAPNLSPDPETGISDWSEEQFITAMRVGTRPDGTVMLTLMPYPYYSFWTDDDLKAVYRYLRTLPPQQNQVPAAEYLAEITQASGAPRGKALFEVYCVACHGEQGKGATPASVALAQVAPGLDDAALRDFITNGFLGTRMPGFGRTLTSEQIADLIAFIRSLGR